MKVAPCTNNEIFFLRKTPIFGGKKRSFTKTTCIYRYKWFTSEKEKNRSKIKRRKNQMTEEQKRATRKSTSERNKRLKKMGKYERER